MYRNFNTTCSSSHHDSQLLSPFTPTPPLYKSQLVQSSKSSTVLFAKIMVISRQLSSYKNIIALKLYDMKANK